jgi:hypothetical protein
MNQVNKGSIGTSVLFLCLFNGTFQPRVREGDCPDDGGSKHL